MHCILHVFSFNHNMFCKSMKTVIDVFTTDGMLGEILSICCAGVLCKGTCLQVKLLFYKVLDWGVANFN